jgi:PIN domain nuclease of toxin-antitoxin system
VNILLDSHAFLWFVADDLKLSIDARTAIEDSTNRKWISIASLWEITIKVSIGKLNLADPVSEFLSREILCNKFSTLNVTMDHSAKLSVLPFNHRDPFDRLIVSQALLESFPVVSTDASLDAYGIDRIW